LIFTCEQQKLFLIDKFLAVHRQVSCHRVKFQFIDKTFFPSGKILKNIDYLDHFMRKNEEKYSKYGKK
jgi:hypothetical protein